LYFSVAELFPLSIGVLLLITSTLLFIKNKRVWCLFFLFIGSSSFGYFIAALDPFLILWDEQFHALVAKNLIENPFKPILYKTPVLPYDYKNWTENSVWLHKQPLFLWQMALSLKIFGINALAVRLPSVFLHGLLSLLTFRLGELIITKKTGFIAALLFSVAYFPLEMVAGRYSTDHNDVAFLFYVTLSLWAWVEYYRSKKPYWLIIIGLTSGMAILVKWLVGLLVFGAWGIQLLFTEYDHSFLNKLKPFLISLMVTILVFVPWQLYTYLSFPIESLYELKLNSDHFFTAIEKHSGSAWFHIVAVKDLYGGGIIVPYILLVIINIGLF